MQSIDQIIASRPSMRSVLAALVEDAPRSLGIGLETARVASYATERALRGRMRSQGLSPAEERRVRAYFSAVVRSQAFRRRRQSDERYRDRIKVASLVADLRAIGTPADRIREEVDLFFGEEGLRLLAMGEVA